MDNISTLVIAALPIWGVVIGASLQYFFSKSTEARKHLTALRTQAYIDYLRCFAESKHVGQDNLRVKGEILAKATDAKTRILIYGSSGVLEALASFEKMGPALDPPEAIKAFLTLCMIMRKESLGKITKTKPETLAPILFRSKD